MPLATLRRPLLNIVFRLKQFEALTSMYWLLFLWLDMKLFLVSARIFTNFVAVVNSGSSELIVLLVFVACLKLALDN